MIPTCQKSNVNLVEWGESADVEKDRLLEHVRDTSNHPIHIRVCTFVSQPSSYYHVVC